MVGTRSFEKETIMEPQINRPQEPIRQSSIKLSKIEMDQNSNERENYIHSICLIEGNHTMIIIFLLDFQFRDSEPI